MKRYNPTHLPDLSERGAVIALGNFDGLHKGHQIVIKKAMHIGAKLNAKAGVMTFEPHPRQFFAPDAPAFRLMNAESRATRLEWLGADLLYEVGFDDDLTKLSPSEFVEHILHEKYGVSHVVVGEDFRFGHQRAGDVKQLEACARTHGIDVTIVALEQGTNGFYSSTAIRKLLSEGKPREAAEMLGHWHRIEGIVEHGFKRGRELGFRTANVSMKDLHLPKFGIYAATVEILTGPLEGKYKGAASLGSRPTFGDNLPNIEVHLLDFDADIYDEHISIGLVDYQRPELKFNSIDELISQMNDDVIKTRAILEQEGF